MFAVVATGDANADRTRGVGGGNVLRRVAKDEHALRIEP